MPSPLVIGFLCAAAWAAALTSCGTVTTAGGKEEADGVDAGLGPGDAGRGASDGETEDLCDFTVEPGPDRVLPAMDDPRSGKEIYDEFFAQHMPAHEDFGWHDALWLTYDWVESHHFPSPVAGLDNEIYHNLFDFNPFNFRRPGLAGLDRADDNTGLFGAQPDTVHRTYDPTEWMPAVASTYTRTPTSDIMARQFWFRARTPAHRPHLERALELCPDCDDVFTPLSHNDLYKIIEVRFVRFQGTTAQLSRTFKLIGIDSSGAMEAHARNDEWRHFGELDGQTATAKWRLELSGLLAQRYWKSETQYIRLMPVLVRASKEATLFQYYDGAFDRQTPPDDPYERQYNPGADGECIRDCHAELCQAGRSVEGYYYVRNENCSCTLLRSPLGELGARHAQGRCEDWPADVWATSPSSGACSL